ncbi:hypothetical protein HPP92_000483 [Vanilla planifolia]|uniref:CCT domain-containing protein n=1 Tax=Vanilla planifolia TaxID=51239 RepID=A0A835VKY0_VANPL|nr:hypothetical protein HPP92_000483 [Vanilla planifolia]
MYAGLAALQIFRTMDGELRHCLSGDQSRDLPFMVNVMNFTLSEYDVGDLFNPPEPIIEEPSLELDPITAAICLMSSGEDVGAVEAMKLADLESIQNEHLMSEVFYDCKKDLLEKSAIKESFDEPPDAKLPAVQVVQAFGMEEVKPNYNGFREINLKDSCGIRTYSDGDVQSFGNGGLNFEEKVALHSSFEHHKLPDLEIDGKMEERMEKINRYKKKKSKRNFCKKIKYACRKALADSQPRVRGRFAKTMEFQAAKLQQV